jgi:hypothetical protein
MRLTLLALATLAVVMGDTRPSAARQWYPWCAQLADRSGATQCAFSTFEACLASVRGIGGSCVQNWHPAPGAPRRDKHWQDFYR